METLHVFEIPPDTSESDLLDAFSKTLELLKLGKTMIQALAEAGTEQAVLDKMVDKLIEAEQFALFCDLELMWRQPETLEPERSQ